jgi:hypothetical protein
MKLYNSEFIPLFSTFTKNSRACRLNQTNSVNLVEVTYAPAQGMELGNQFITFERNSFP